MNRIPTLDGWRGVAILLVIVSHLQTSLLGHLYCGYSWMDVGQHGVEIFFILSGYLITTLLLEEEKINLKRFYLRRFFRLEQTARKLVAHARRRQAGGGRDVIEQIEAERARLGRELHTGVGQLLVSILRQAELAEAQVLIN